MFALLFALPLAAVADDALATAASSTDPTVGTTDPATETGPSDVDPGYLRHLSHLEQMGDLPLATGPQPQLWDGMVGLYDLKGIRKGTVFVGGPDNPKQELWFMPSAVDPGAGFVFWHLGWYEPGTEAVELEAVDKNWDVNPCFTQWAKYTTKPDPQLTAQMVYDALDLYAFDIYHDNALVGHMLREHHQIDNAPEKFVDHWAFYDPFAFPDGVGENVWVVPAGSYDTTAAFFADLHLEDDEWQSFTQIQYTRQPGFKCLANIGF